MLLKMGRGKGENKRKIKERKELVGEQHGGKHRIAIKYICVGN